MLTKAKIQDIRNLKDKKQRTKRGVFVVEGEKSVVELLHSDLTVRQLYATHEFIKAHVKELNDKHIQAISVEAGELEAMGTLESNQHALAVVSLPADKVDNTEPIKGVYLAVDTIRDPGNLGTIIRLADWYGIDTIYASIDSVDMYNSKCISATMGSFTRVRVVYANLVDLLSHTSLPVITTHQTGKSVHAFQFPQDGILVIGSESHGISKEVRNIAQESISIPGSGRAESLNAALACGIVLDNWARSTHLLKK